jgi:hypothetical protein
MRIISHRFSWPDQEVINVEPLTFHWIILERIRHHHSLFVVALFVVAQQVKWTDVDEFRQARQIRAPSCPITTCGQSPDRFGELVFDVSQPLHHNFARGIGALHRGQNQLITNPYARRIRQNTRHLDQTKSLASGLERFAVVVKVAEAGGTLPRGW